MLNGSYFNRRQLILNIIHHFVSISRTELVELTDYRPATVSEIIKELLDMKLIVETGHSSGGQGRRRTMLALNKNRLCAIGISFTPTNVLCIAAGIDGTIFSKATLPITSAIPKQTLAAQITDVIKGLINEHSSKEIVGIGICRPFYDPLSYKSEHSLQANYTHFHDWIHQHLQPLLEQSTQIRVQSFSPVTLPALAEQQFGVAKGAQNFLCIELSNGIGASIFCNGAAVEGANGLAGELGHTVIDYHPSRSTLCYCGKPDCVEITTAYPSLAADISKALENGVFSELQKNNASGHFTIYDIRNAVDAGDRMCIHFVKESAKRIGIAIANAVNLLNPELIVLNGFMLELGDCFIQQLESSIRENTMPLENTFSIKTSSSLETILPLGAAAELFSVYLDTNHYNWVYQIPKTHTVKQEP